MTLKPGDVIRAHDHTVRPPKAKRHVCVCPVTSRFLRVNTQAFFKPHVKITPAECNFIEIDSYIELGNLCYLHPGHVANGTVLGFCSDTVLRRILVTLRHGGWMPEDDVDFIEGRFFPAP